jgi:uncharacterized membrane protein YciS (DUF1049 family)
MHDYLSNSHQKLSTKRTDFFGPLFTLCIMRVCYYQLALNVSQFQREIKKINKKMNKRGRKKPEDKILNILDRF